MLKKILVVSVIFASFTMGNNINLASYDDQGTVYEEIHFAKTLPLLPTSQKVAFFAITMLHYAIATAVIVGFCVAALHFLLMPSFIRFVQPLFSSYFFARDFLEFVYWIAFTIIFITAMTIILLISDKHVFQPILLRWCRLAGKKPIYKTEKDIDIALANARR